jgi:NADP-dependent 3-hydroxy acid dehydrogenase YdfG
MGSRSRETVALVTGASAGIGRAVCRELVRRGARVVMVARRRERLSELESELGGSAVGVVGDVTRDDGLDAAVATARSTFGRLDVALANAGFGVGRPVERLEVDDFRRQFDTNVLGVLRTLYATLPDLKSTRGVFAVTGSVAGHLATPGSVAYSMSKFAVRALAEGLRTELAPSRVDVVLLSPGYVASEIRQVDRHGRHRPEFRDPVPEWLQMPADVAARKMVRAIERRRPEAVITVHGRLLVAMARHFPRLARVVAARL